MHLQLKLKWRRPAFLLRGGITMIELMMAGGFMAALIYAGSNFFQSSQLLYNYRLVKGQAVDSLVVMNRQLRRLALTENDGASASRAGLLATAPNLYRTFSFNSIKASSSAAISMTNTCVATNAAIAAKVKAALAPICPNVCSGNTVPNISITENGAPRTDLLRVLSERWFLGHAICFQDNPTYPNVAAARIGIVIDTRKGPFELVHNVSQIGRVDTIQWIE